MLEQDPIGLFHYIVGVITICFALLVVFARNPVVSAMGLMATLFSTGLLFFGMGAQFIAAVQILVYAGAIAVLFAFIQMLLDLKTLKFSIPGRKLTMLFGFVAALVMLGGLFVGVLPFAHSALSAGDVSKEIWLESLSAKAISQVFLSKYMIPFQMTALLILGAIMGAVILARPNRLEGESKAAEEGNR